MNRWNALENNERNKPEQKIDIDQIAKEILKSMENDIEFRGYTGISGAWTDTLGTYSTYIQDENSFDLLKPVRIIYNGRTTICKWKDGTKTVVKATKDDNPTHEHGLAMSVMRKLFDSRQEFLRLVDGGYDVIEEGKKREIAEKERKEKAYLEKLRIKTRKEELSQLRNISEKNIDGE